VYGGITSPGNDPYALTVGALDTHGSAERSDDTVATYSSHGPTRYDHIVKPDLVAPGSHIVSAEVIGSYISNTAGQLHVTGAGDGAYIKLSGTSMATGVASGAVALLLEGRPTLLPADVKAVVQLTSSFMPEGLLTSGAGSLNVLAAATFISSDFRKLPIVSIAGERVAAGGLTTSLGPDSIVRGDSDAIIWSSQILWGSAIIWSTSDSSIWGNSDAIIWSSQILWGSAIIWSSSDAIIWSSADAIIWSSSDAIIWSSSDAIIWSSSDAIIWSSSDAIIWSSADAIIWSSSDAIIWSSSDAIIWSSSDAIIWSSSDAIIWSS
jgi:serine protease AprX